MFYRIYKNVSNKVKSLIYFIEEKKTQYVNKIITQNFTQLGSIKIGFQINNIGTSSIDWDGLFAILSVPHVDFLSSPDVFQSNYWR
jgi:hypothetical protein